MSNKAVPSSTSATNLVRTAGASDESWQQEFLAMLPAIRRHALIRFRGLAAEVRAELVQETIARALVGYCRLVEQGREHVATASSLARFAVAQVRSGRRVGARLNGRDVSSAYCQRRRHVTVRSLTESNEASSWREVLVEDRHAGPAETAAARIDIGQWLRSLPERTRRLAEKLAMGESTSSVARMFGITPSRVSQLRRELCGAWQTFQAEPASTNLT